MVLVVKNPPANAADMRPRFNPWVGKIPWRRAQQTAPVFLPGKSHEQRSLADCKRVQHDLVTEQQQGKKQMREINRHKLPGTKKSQYEMYCVGNIVNNYVIKSLVT